jgi:DNA-binding CsgD family transcriptional regulator/AraC-like DNA-binding protein
MVIDVEQAKDLYLNKGMTLGEVAQFLGTHYEAVRQKLHSLGVVRTKKVKVNVNLIQLKLLWESDNYTLAELAKHFNVSIPTIKRRLRTIKARHRYAWNYSHENPINQRIIKLYTNDHLSTMEIGKLIHLSEETVRRRLHRLSITLRDRAFKNLARVHPKSFDRRHKDYQIADVQELNERIKQLYLSGNKKLKTIAHIVNLDTRTVARRLDFMGYRNRKKMCEKDMEQVKRCADLYKDKKLSSNQIGRIEGISGSKVIKLLRFASIRLRQRTGISTTVKKRVLRIYKIKNHLYEYLRQCRRCERLYRTKSQGSRICPKCSRSNHRASMQSHIHSNNNIHLSGEMV